MNENLLETSGLLNYSLQPAFVMKAQPGKLVHPFSFVTKRLRNRDGGLNPNIALWNAYVGYHFNKGCNTSSSMLATFRPS